MPKKLILESLTKKKEQNKKSLAILLDPDKIEDEHSLAAILDICIKSAVDCIFVGGSLLINDSLGWIVRYIKHNSTIPLVLFPGSTLQIDKSADAILFLSLISGRNPDLLIGQHVVAAPILRNSKLEVLSTGYMLIGDDASTTVAHISQTSPIPTEKPEIAVCTALAGEMMGMKLIYLDAGSGPKKEVPSTMIEQVCDAINIPLIVGGGINTLEKAKTAYQAGADMIVLGTAVEDNVDFISEVAEMRQLLAR